MLYEAVIIIEKEKEEEVNFDLNSAEIMTWKSVLIEVSWQFEYFDILTRNGWDRDIWWSFVLNGILYVYWL